MTNTIKKCIRCGAVLVEGENWKVYAKGNYVNKCDECLKIEKREYAREWARRNPEKARARCKKHRDKIKKENPKLYKCRQMAGSAQKRAKKHGWDFEINGDYLYSIAPDYCPILGVKIDYTANDKRKYSASIDRIDSSKGYTKDNVQIISYLANLMKSNATPEEMVKFAEYVIREIKSKLEGQ